MGVFSRFRRKAVEESTEEAASTTVTAETEEVVEAGPEATASPAESEPAAQAAPAETAEPAAAEGMEIPKQQSAEEAADNEAGESARK